MDPVVIPRAQHPISRKLMDPDALKVMYRLIHNGHKAYLVGGGVRDLLLGRTPKDFDIGTDAHPNRIKKLFRNCRLVGRRFRLAHVHFGDKIIEVSTFRTRAEFENQAGEDRLIRSDNTFGTPEEDAYRRDFSINGLFYDLETFSVLDYVGGMQDLDARTIRSIGDPFVRMPEDPVRIMRAIKFSARLGFSIEPKLWSSMKAHAADIHKCAKARVLEEIYRLLRSGISAESFQLLQECGLLTELLPEVQARLETRLRREKDGDRLFWDYLEALDEMRAGGQALSNALLLGALSVHLVDAAVGTHDHENRIMKDFAKSVNLHTHDLMAELGIARRDREKLAHILTSQPRFVRPRGRRFRPGAFVSKLYYPDAELLFELGCNATGLELNTLARWKSLYAEVQAARPGAKQDKKKRVHRRGSRHRKRSGRGRASRRN